MCADTAGAAGERMLLGQRQERFARLAGVGDTTDRLRQSRTRCQNPWILGQRLQEEMQKLARMTSHRPSVSMGELRGSISVVGKSLEGAEPTDRHNADEWNRALPLLGLGLQPIPDTHNPNLQVLSVGLCLIRITKRTTNYLRVMSKA